MRLRPTNYEKELKKTQNKGLYNKKLKIAGVVGVIIGTALIYTTYAFFNYNSTKAISFNSQVDKKVNIEIEVKNGTTENSKITTKYNQELRVKVNPNEGYTYESVVCTNSQTGTYDETNNELIIKPTIYTKCTVTFKETCVHKSKETKNIFGKEYKVLSACNPDFSTGFPNSMTSKEDVDQLSGLYKTTDETGITYYFRGAVENNYVKFGQGTTETNSQKHELIWRILRINGDKSIRLILNESIGNSQFNNLINGYSYPRLVGFTSDNNYSEECTRNNPCEVTYTNKIFTNTIFEGSNSTIKTYLEKWYTENLNDVNNEISSSYFCNDTSTSNTYSDSNIYYGAYVRLNKAQPTLICPDPKDKDGSFATKGSYGGIYKTKIGLITADELIMGGYPPLNNQNKEDSASRNYLDITDSYYWTLSPEKGSSAYVFAKSNENGKTSAVASAAGLSVVPVINLNSDVKISRGDGTKNNPYVINT